MSKKSEYKDKFPSHDGTNFHFCYWDDMTKSQDKMADSRTGTKVVSPHAGVSKLGTGPGMKKRKKKY